ncbi:MAG: hypothetical protein ACI89J_001387 [Hyphomicrobiaceae bacterium]|jgi:hypothetical protein
MTIRLGTCALAVAIFSFAPQSASAQCASNDLACQKFGSNSAPKKSTSRRKRATYRSRKKTRRVATRRRNTVVPTAAVASVASVTATATPKTTTANIATSLPVANLTRLQPGAISEAPKHLPNLKFGSGDQVEIVTAKCNPIERSNRRVACAVAVHRLAITSEAGAGCVASLGLREIEFVKTEQGNWVSEDSIALCGGRLLRRTELFPVAVNDSPRYALREEYQMLGGDRACAAPYLRSRRPLRKSYMPGGNRSTRGLHCGTVASR